MTPGPPQNWRPPKEPVYCMHCANWYVGTKADQCEFYGKIKDPQAYSNALGTKIVLKKEYGHPSETNKNNDCEHYRDIGFLGRVKRRIFNGIPIHPTTGLESHIIKKDKGGVLSG